MFSKSLAAAVVQRTCISYAVVFRRSAFPFERRLRRAGQAALAKRVGASSAFTNAVEKDRYLLGLDLAFRIARAIDKPIEEVFLYEETEHTRHGVR
jgi:putative transcriptional regulator